MTPHCDGLTVTCDPMCFDHVAESLAPLLGSAGGMPSHRGFAFPTGVPSRAGHARVEMTHGVGRVHLSGAALASLRAAELFLDVLHVLGSVPHRVTLIDLALDDADTDAPEYLEALYRRAKAGQVSLTRKRIAPSAVRAMLSPSLVDGRDTGTVYLGDRRRHEATARAYDKRQERLQFGFADPGPLLRTEVTARAKLRPSLRDAVDCGPLFYHLAAPCLVELPTDVVPFSAAGEGYELPPRVPALDTARLRRLIDNGAADPLLRLAASIGAHGWDYLSLQLKRRADFLAKPSVASDPPAGAARTGTAD